MGLLPVESEVSISYRGNSEYSVNANNRFARFAARAARFSCRTRQVLPEAVATPPQADRT
jgi:hypothetical protein